MALCAVSRLRRRWKVVAAVQPFSASSFFCTISYRFGLALQKASISFSTFPAIPKGPLANAVLDANPMRFVAFSARPQQ